MREASLLVFAAATAAISQQLPPTNSGVDRRSRWQARIPDDPADRSGA
jgi:hypothetical protein